MGYATPPPPAKPLRGDREEMHLAWAREMYATGVWTLYEFEASVDRVLAGGFAWDARFPPPPEPDYDFPPRRRRGTTRKERA